jgi:EAL domain-containing protein (putative c-di-GMP-specific phosphodiesterase class I)
LVKWVIWKNNKQNTDILRSIIEFWHLHWSKIIAEYVENEEIQNIVEILWIEYSQWYYFSKPTREISKK